MKTKMRTKIVAMALATLMSAAPVWGSVYAAEEAIESPAAIEQTMNEAEEASEEKAEVREEQEMASPAEEIREEAKAEAEVKAEMKAEQAEIKTELKPAAEEQAELKPAVEEQAEAEEEDSPVVVLDQAPSEKLSVHISNILWTAKSSSGGKAVPFESLVTMTNGQGKLATGFNSFVGGKNTSASTVDGTYKFLNVFVLSKAGSGIVTAESENDVRAIKKINFSKGTATVTFADGSTKQIVNASDLYISPVYKFTAIKKLNFRYIDGVSTGSGSWANQGEFSSMTHTFRQPEGQDHYRFINWENDETGLTYIGGDKLTIKKAELTADVTDVNIYANWQPSVTVRYHYNGEVIEAESFESVRVYDEATEIDGINYNAWYGEDGSILPEGTEYEAPAPVRERIEREIHDVYARRPLTIGSASGSWTYDGEEHGDDAIEIVAGGLFDGDIIEAEVTGSVRDVTDGEVANTIESVRIMRNGTDVTEYYDIDTIEGTLEVKAAPAAPAAPAATTGNDDNNKTAGTTVRRDPAPAAAPEAEAEAAAIENTPVPMAAPAVTTIEDAEAPLAENGAWALLNLILAAVTGLISAVLLAGWLGKKRDDEAEDDDEDRTERKGFARVASILPAAAAIIAFILTENMNLQMAFTDRWTLLMVIILAVQTVIALLSRKSVREDDEEADTEAVIA